MYMATYNPGEVDPGELRFLARLQTSEVPTGVHGNVGDTRGCTAFEGKDTSKCPDGHTSCKMYTSDRFIDDKVHCVAGSVSFEFGLEITHGLIVVENTSMHGDAWCSLRDLFRRSVHARHQ